MKNLTSKVLYLFILCMGVSVAASAQNIRIKASVDSAMVLMGDVTHLRVQVEMPQQVASKAQLIDFPVLTPGVEYIPFKGVDVVASDSSSNTANGRTQINFDFSVQAFDPGTVEIPPFAVLPPGGDTVFSNVVALKVLPMPVDSMETINPMPSVVAPNSKWYDFIPNWLLWTLLGIAVAVAGVAAYVLFGRHKKKVEELKAKPLPPYELAMDRLSSLRSRKLSESGQEKAFYTELVDILRQYLHGRFGINAMEMTSTQIVRALRANSDTRTTAEQMRAILAMADFVKFAKVRPLPDDNNRAFASATSFVEQTKPAPEPEPEEADKAAKPADKASKK